MHTFFISLSESIINAMGWTIIHSVWQGLVVALLLFIFLNSFKKTTAQAKYRVATLALVLTFGLALTTFCLLWQPPSSQTMVSLDQSVGESDLMWISNSEKQLSSTASKYQMLIQFINENINTIVWAWMAGVVIFTLRLLGAMTYLQKLKREAQLPDSDHWQEILNEMIDRLNFKKPILLLTSTTINVPVALGYLKPVILFPVGILNQLSVEEAESILAHECAHIIRNDYLLNIIQSIIEALLYFNPGVWWISDFIRRERENSCDDIALRVSGNQMAYAKALVALQEYEMNAPKLAMGLSNNKYRLLNRIQRILQQPQKNVSTMEKVIASILLCCFVLLFSVAANKQGDIKQQPAESCLSAFPIVQDSLPKGKVTLEVTRNDSTISSEIENGTLKSLSIDGEKIAEKDLPNYESYVEGIIRDLPGKASAPKAFGSFSPNDRAFLRASGLNPAILKSSNRRDQVILFFDQKGDIVAKIFTEEGDEEDIDIQLENGGLVIVKGDTLIRGFTRFKTESYSPFAISSQVQVAPRGFSFPSDSTFLRLDKDNFAFQFDFDEEKLNELKGISRHFQRMHADTFPKGGILKNKDLFFFEDMEVSNDSIRRDFIAKQQEKNRELQQKMAELQRQLAETSKGLTRKYQEMHRQRQEELEKEHDMIMEERKRSIESRERISEQRRREREKMMEKQRQLEDYSISPRKQLESALLSDRLVKSTDQYELEISPDEFKVNGIKVKDENDLKAKYLGLAAGLVGQPLSENAEINIRVSQPDRFSFSVKD